MKDSNIVFIIFKIKVVRNVLKVLTDKMQTDHKLSALKDLLLTLQYIIKQF